MYIRDKRESKNMWRITLRILSCRYMYVYIMYEVVYKVCIHLM